jgi:hypothetical protein
MRLMHKKIFFCFLSSILLVVQPLQSMEMLKSIKDHQAFKTVALLFSGAVIGALIHRAYSIGIPGDNLYSDGFENFKKDADKWRAEGEKQGQQARKKTPSRGTTKETPVAPMSPFETKMRAFMANWLMTNDINGGWTEEACAETTDDWCVDQVKWWADENLDLKREKVELEKKIKLYKSHLITHYPDQPKLCIDKKCSVPTCNWTPPEDI